MKNKRIHPSPVPSSLTFLSCLPAALLALASTLSPQEQQVLSYLLGSEKPNNKKSEKKQQKNHAPSLDCSCFGCYMSFWAVWDSSPNRHVIHLILDEYEARLEGRRISIKSGSKGKSKKKKSSKKSNKSSDFDKGADVLVKKDDCGDEGYNGYFDDVYEEEEEEEEKGSIRKFLSWAFGIN